MQYGYIYYVFLLFIYLLFLKHKLRGPVSRTQILSNTK